MKMGTGEHAMKSFRCGDVVAGCTAAFMGTENEILAGVAEHGRHAHELGQVAPELVARVRAAMQSV